MLSILDNDLYKFTMQNAVLKLYPNTWVEYTFICRNKNTKFTKDFLNEGLIPHINKLCELKTDLNELEYLKSVAPFFSPDYIEYLKNYRYNKNNLEISITPEGDLIIKIKGYWHETILWEVPLLAAISENYFIYVDKDWNEDGQIELIDKKGNDLSSAGCYYTDFSTRRRRNYNSQDRVVSVLKNKKGFLGTSNVHFGAKYKIPVFGTMAHEFISAHQVLGGIKHCNKYALEAWNSVYKGMLAIALPDTIGTDAFFEDFNLELSKLFDGLRHDSGDPIIFTDKVLTHYKFNKIDPMSKSIMFSDSLNVEKCIAIKDYCKDKIKPFFGIGTFFSNDYQTPALNIVIKLVNVKGKPVVKLSDVPTKAVGDKDAIRATNWIVHNKPLDEQ